MGIEIVVTYTIKINDMTWTFTAPSNLTTAELLSRIPAGEFNDPDWDNMIITQRASVLESQSLPDWVRVGTAAQAETKINNDFSLPAVGSLENAKEFINTNMADIPTSATTVAQLRTAINTKLAVLRAVLGAMVDLFIIIRNYYIIIAKLLIYIRDLVIRFRGG